MTTPIPESGTRYKGVMLFGEQSERSMARARRHIDAVSVMGTADLEAVCKDRAWAAEARRLAAALLTAEWEKSADAGSVRPSVDLEEIAAHTGHIGLSWHRILEKWPPDDDDDDG